MYFQSIKLVANCVVASRTNCILFLIPFYLGTSLIIPSTQANDSIWNWDESLNAAASCESAFNQSESIGARCFADQTINQLLIKSTQQAEKYGKRVFGPHFQIQNRLNFSSSGGQLIGHIDAVVPFSFSELQGTKNGTKSAFFVQQGVTSWRDESNNLRNDQRTGFVFRFQPFDALNNDIFGISAFYQSNLDIGHQVFVSRFDYAGRWGTSSLTHFTPMSGWITNNQNGREEKALEGTELGVNWGLTSTIDLGITGYRWQSKDGSKSWVNGARTSVNWHPHTYLRIRADYDESQTNSNSSIWFGVEIPLGGKPERPRWLGFGTAPDQIDSNEEQLYRIVDDIGRIRFASRRTVSLSELVDEAHIRFLRDSVETGGEFAVEVSINSPAPQDLNLVLRLVPGDGPNPVVAGVDYVDEPISVVILNGETTATVFIRLLVNENMETNRSLSATVSLAS